KVILSGQHASAGEAIRFRREAEAVARVHHPNLVLIYEVGQHDGQAYLSLEYVPGVSLERHLAGKPQPAKAAARPRATLAEAAHAAHARGVAPRDLKPANVLLQPSDPGGEAERARSAVDATAPPPAINLHTATPKVTDFGLAKCLDGPPGVTASAVVAGT